MALNPNFPKSPYEILDPAIRWFPGDENLFQDWHFKLLPPLVQKIRIAVNKWREAWYEWASQTSIALLNFWFKEEHILLNSAWQQFLFKYYFAQREAVESVVYLYEVAQARDKYDLIKFDWLWAVSANMFQEDWTRYVIKMATGSGKTKVMSLVLARSYFHRLYEPDSTLSKNFLVIAPNIIVLDRIRADFDWLKIFFEDPILPDNGYEWQNRREDFQITLHIQDEIWHISPTWNIFLTNIHRVFDSWNIQPSFDDDDTSDYFLGKKPVGKTNESKLDLWDIVRSVDELMVINDEAHHLHDSKLAWFKSIEDIKNRLRMKWKELSLQIDVTATPKHDNGGIFVQVISDYPLVEAIHQNVVKTPVLPDEASRSKLKEYKSIKYSEMYKDYINLWYLEWKQYYENFKKDNKKAILFVMTDDTRNCDEVAEYLCNTYPEFQDKDSVLVIHTKDNWEIKEVASGKDKEELERLRKLSNEIDNIDSPYKVVISVLMLREWWDVKNVTTIVWLRPYKSKSNILPEQTLWRWLRRMFRNQQDLKEYISVVWTPAFMDFVESIKEEWVELERKNMGIWWNDKMPLIIEIDNQNVHKDIEKLDIELPILTPRIFREYKNLSELNIDNFVFETIQEKYFSEKEQKEIIFKDITSWEISHTTFMGDDIVPSYNNVIWYFAKVIMRELRLFNWYDVLYWFVKQFIKTKLFGKEIELENLNILRNLSELETTKTIVETFKKEINTLTVVDKWDAEIKNHIKISKTRPFVINNQAVLIPKKSIFNKIIWDSHFELQFASFLDWCEDIISFAKNDISWIWFKMDYINTDWTIAYYYPDFFVKKDSKTVYIIELKWREDLDDILKIKRLKQYVNDANLWEKIKIKYEMIYIKQEQYEKYYPKNFEELIKLFKN